MNTKRIYMIKDYFPLLFQAMGVGTGGLLNILHRLYQLLKKKICVYFHDVV